MPSLGFGEIVLVMLLALIIFGPKRLPEMGRTIGRSMKEFRKAAADLRQELESSDVRKDFEVEAADIRNDLESGLEETPKASVEERATRLAQHQENGSPEPPRGDAPPT